VSGQPGQRPATVQAGLRQLAEWLDEADRLIDQLAKMRMLRRPNSGDAVQRDMRRLADWFEAHPIEAVDAWAYVANGGSR
jgi:hypothetical protein